MSTTTAEITWTNLMSAKPVNVVGVEVASKQSPTGMVRITRVGAIDWYTAEAIEDFGGRLPKNASRGAYRVTLYGEPC